ncbi:MAG: hypothetical protein SNJ77_04585 [Cytophagales bacterium]
MDTKKVCGQQLLNRVVETNSNYWHVELKWFETGLINNYDEVNVLRASKNMPDQWVKVNKKPIKRYVLPPKGIVDKRTEDFLKKTEPLLGNDNELRMALGLAGQKDLKLEGVNLLMVLTNAFKSNELCEMMGIWFADSSVVFGNAYQYKIIGHKNGQTKTIAKTDNWIEVFKTEVFTPKDLLIERKKKKVDINIVLEKDKFWAYNLYYTESGSWKRINNKPILLDQAKKENYVLLMSIDSLKEGKRYQFQHTGIDYFGKESKPSKTSLFEMKDQTPPKSPEQFASNKVENGKVFLKWKNADTTDVEKIFVWRKKAKENYQNITPNGLSKLSQQYIDSSKLNKGEYFYKLSVVDKSGNTAESNEALADVPDYTPPSPPKLTKIKSDTGKIILEWKLSSDKDLLGVRIFRGVIHQNDTNFALLNTDPLKGLIFTDSLAKNSKALFAYKLKAIDSSFNASPYSNTLSVQLPDVTAPHVPKWKNVNQSGASISLNWFPVADLDLKHFLLEKTEIDSKTKSKISIIKISKDSLSYVDKLIEAGKIYQYRLGASDLQNNISEFSKPWTVTCLAWQNGTWKGEVLAKNRKKRSILKWQNQENAESYDVFVKKKSEAEFMVSRVGLTNTQVDFEEKIKNLEFKIAAKLKNGAVLYSQTLSF